MNNIKRFIVIPLSLLTACASQKPLLDQQSLAIISPHNLKHQEQVTTVSSWKIRGAIAAKNKSKGWSATLNWVQRGAKSYQIRLMGPLGAGTVVIIKQGNLISYQDGPKKITSTNADELLMQQTGIRLPVNNLYYWIRGLPAPGTKSDAVRDKDNRLIELKQSGYHINFTNYLRIKGIDLPGMVRLDGNGIMVKVLIKNWTI